MNLGVAKRLVSEMLAWAHDILVELDVDAKSIRLIEERFAQASVTHDRHFQLHERLYFDAWPMLDWRDWTQPQDIPEVIYGECHQRQDHVVVLANGDVVLCCLDFDGQTRLGNVYDQLLTDILNGEKAQWITSEFARGRVAEHYCRKCMGHWQQTLQRLRKGRSTADTQAAIRASMLGRNDIWPTTRVSS
ncbi:SPASM domain-containing protein [Planctomycetota bacterium]